MRRISLIAVCVPVALYAGPVAIASSFTKPKVLPAATEAKWLQAVKTHKTKDGSTVSEVLAYTQKMRPREFKAGRFDVGYNGATGAADTVTIDYWIGNKRAPGDAYADLVYHMTYEGRVLPVAETGSTTAALEAGRDSFLRYVVEMYRSTCRSEPASPPTC